MLEQSLKEQLQDIFSKIEIPIELKMYKSNHPKQQELKDFLGDLAEVSKMISLSFYEQDSSIPTFHLYSNGKKSGITYQGIPTGHEFSSLVLSILNLGGLGKFPDNAIQNRIRNIKGPIHLKTYISLECENCPEVVQSLNLMAIIHPSFKHEMIDGALAQDEVKQLGIQGVPSVMHGEHLLISGKTDFLKLLETLEQNFGSEILSPKEEQGHAKNYDVVVAGGGPAGVAAAIYSARKGLSVALVAPKIGGQVLDTKGIENFIATSYVEGPQLANSYQEHLRKYKVDVYEHRKIVNLQNEDLKKIILDSNEILLSKSLIVATGAQWRKLGIPGESEYIGRGVAFCPHCDGPYYAGKDVAVIGGGNSGIEAAIDLAGMVKSVTVFEFASQLKADQVLVDKLAKLKNAKVVVSARTKTIVGDGKKVISLVYENLLSKKMEQMDLDGVFIQIGLIPNSDVFKNLLEVNRMGEIVVDGKGRTSVRGIYAAGDVTTTPFKQIVIATGEGAKAALTSFEELMA